MGTSRDDLAIWKHNVLGTAAGDDNDWGMQSQTVVDAHGQEGQLGKVIPKETIWRPGSRKRDPPTLLLPYKIPSAYNKITDGSNSSKLIMLFTLNMDSFSLSITLQ